MSVFALDILKGEFKEHCTCITVCVCIYIYYTLFHRIMVYIFFRNAICTTAYSVSLTIIVFFFNLAEFGYL